MSLRAGETNYTRLPGSVTFVRSEWRERQTLFTKEACKRHRVHPALLAEMLGEKTGIYAWIVDPQRSTAFTASQRLAAETLLLSPRPLLLILLLLYNYNISVIIYFHFSHFFIIKIGGGFHH